MRLSRIGSAHQSRLSFMRTLLRRMKRENWQFECSLWEVNERGVGRAVYQAKNLKRTYSLVAFAHDLPDELRSDRVIAEAWDATFTLFDGIPSEADLQRLADNVPKQEAGRVSATELSLSRANRSVRMFDYVANTLAKGEQPDREQIERVGYLMRTTAVYGSGKFGAADRDKIQDREELTGPFQAEMLSVWLTRAFTLDLVEHIAKVRGGDQAVTLEPSLRRCFGVGNSTGLGMAPFIVNHPILLNNWMMAREEALARVRGLDKAEPAAIASFGAFLTRATINAEQWQSKHPIQQPKIQTLQQELRQFTNYFEAFDASQEHPWNTLYEWAEQHVSEETQEQIAMLMLEPYPELVDGLTDCMNADETLPLIDASMSIQAMRDLLREHYHWALTMDFTDNSSRSRFWYVSEEKLEPRLGERFDEPGMELEQPLCVAWHVWQLDQALKDICNSNTEGHSTQTPISHHKPMPELAPTSEKNSHPMTGNSRLAEFLLAKPEFRHIVRRVQMAVKYPYMEIRDNLIDSDMLPIDLLRLKLSFFGATRFDPRSDRWVRITMFQNAPFPHELAEQSADDWAYPPLAATAT
ncbi:hypothetical protein DKW60_00580 [Leucothrix pacifica]|uniref:Uncharacterized protein n=2 Tax=Leucothrix pacifica TaxID=1247513 RepID=A0A317CQS1_9GAMM|nr:hypothetical protein DKW60_00580 [Leucothrix pacifica]